MKEVWLLKARRAWDDEHSWRILAAFATKTEADTMEKELRGARANEMVFIGYVGGLADLENIQWRKSAADDFDVDSVPMFQTLPTSSLTDAQIDAKVADHLAANERRVREIDAGQVAADEDRETKDR